MPGKSRRFPRCLLPRYGLQYCMKKSGQKTAVSEESVAEQPGARPHESEHGKDCRCEETAAMKPGELLKLMISDLAFWKKAKK